ncbi:MAG: glutamine-hydrolyzing GMP synthase, partial [Oscillospiraceae bacterium]|nr:glutamine-hydrolyzing GMP synthase [Oscillospiraceae bacterium]
MANQLCIVLDFGGQYNQLIARRVRECGVYCEIKRYDTPIEEIKALDPVAIIFTGGPNSVYDMSSPHISKDIFDIGVPVLGICYGCQLVAWTLGGEVKSCEKSEYGKIEISHKSGSLIFKDVPEKNVVWMSHTDYVSRVPEGFTVTAASADCPAAAFENAEKKFYAVQFHPEVTHSEFGKKMLHNFLYEVCGCKGDWVMDDFIEKTVAKLREQIGDKKVVLGLSGGVDSSVAAGLLSRAVGKQLT